MWYTVLGFDKKKSKQNIIPNIVPFNYASNAQKDEPSQKSKHVCVCYDLERERERERNTVVAVRLHHSINRKTDQTVNV